MSVIIVTWEVGSRKNMGLRQAWAKAETVAQKKKKKKKEKGWGHSSNSRVFP
jgi:hypothetical protein